MSSYYIVKESRDDDDQPLTGGTIGRHVGFDRFLMVLELVIPTQLHDTLRLKQSETIPLVDGQPEALRPTCARIESALDLVYKAERTQEPEARAQHVRHAEQLLAIAKADLEILGEPAKQLQMAITDFEHHYSDPARFHVSGQYAIQHVGTAILLARELV